MSTFLARFNDTFAELLDDLARVFPNDPDLPVYKIGAQAALLHQENIVRDAFHAKVVAPFEAQVLARDESFFLGRDYGDVTREFADAGDVIAKLKASWQELGPSEKDTVWKYLRVLVLLDRKIEAESVSNGRK